MANLIRVKNPKTGGTALIHPDQVAQFKAQGCIVDGETTKQIVDTNPPAGNDEDDGYKDE